MFEVDTTELKNSLDSLKSLLDEYEEIELNLFNQLKTSCIDWQDGNSVQFDSRIYQDRTETDLVIASLRMRQSLFEFIYAKYSEFGKKIRCNLNNKATLMGAFDSIESEIQSILNAFDSIDRSFYYSELSIIDSERRKFVRLKSDMKSSKEEAKKLFSKIEDIEKEILERIKELDEVKINEFDFDLP